MSYPQVSTLDCQQCGEVIRKLSLAEVRMVAESPYNYIAYCRLCRMDPDFLVDVTEDGYGSTE